MPILVETSKEYDFRNGRAFYYNYIFLASITSSTPIEFVFIVGKNNIEIDNVFIKGNSSWVTWNWKIGSSVTVDEQTGVDITEIPLNQTIDSSSDTKLILNPAYTGSWLSQLQDIPIYAKVGANNYTVMSENLITRKMALKANTKHMLKLTTVNPASHLEASISFSVMKTRGV